MIRRVDSTKQPYRTTFMQGVQWNQAQRKTSAPARFASTAGSAVSRFFLGVIGLIGYGFSLLAGKLSSSHSRGRRRAEDARNIEAYADAPSSLPMEEEEVTTAHGGSLFRPHSREGFSGWTAVERRFALRAGCIALVIILAAGTALSIPSIRTILASKTISIIDGGTPVEIVSTAATVGQLLDEYGVRLQEGDIVYPDKTQKLSEGDSIQIRRAMSVDTMADGVARALRIQAGTVRDALAIAGVAFREQDIIEPSLDTQLSPGMAISVTRVDVMTVTEEARIHYREIVQEDKTLLVGTREISQKGKEGMKELEIEVVYHDGEEISRDVVSERIVEAPVHRIVKEGTKTAAPKATPTPKATTASAAANNTSTQTNTKKYQVTKYAVVHDGKRYEIEDTGSFMLTAYTHTGRKTSTGTWPKVGTIAVDPKVIPYGTYLYIPDYGIGVARDTGPTGKHLDLFFDTYEECIKFGRQRNKKVYILAKPVKAD